MVDTWKTGKNRKKGEKKQLAIGIWEWFFHESAPEQDKRDARKISSPEKKIK